MPKHTVHWFRRGLRLHDNPSLREGLKGATTFRCIFILDPWFAGSSNVGINKWRFLLQCLEDLDNNLRKLNSRLFVIRGQPTDALPRLFKEWSTTNLTFEEDPEPFGRVRDQNIIAMCKEFNVTTIARASHTLYDLDKIIEFNGGIAPLTYHRFEALVTNFGHPAADEPAVTLKTIQGCYTPISDDHDEKYGVPSLEELGYETENLAPSVWPGGESQALQRMRNHLLRKSEEAYAAAAAASNTSTSTSTSTPPRPKLTTRTLFASENSVSPYLRFGCLSVKLFYRQLLQLFRKLKKSRRVAALHGQLLWREFFYCAATRNPNFDKMQGNPICLQIPWDRDAQATAKWANGQTGFPWIDAIMIQLREEGWIHQVARNATACFLTRGDLWISWEEGMKVFEELLLDADWSVNAGMWMWLSCSSFFHQLSRCYCPVRSGRKADPDGEYIRRYIPVLRDFPTKYIHAPWKAPESVQKDAHCIIGTDYSRPMVVHETASRINAQRLQQVFRQLTMYQEPEPLSPSKKENQSSKFEENSENLPRKLTPG